MSNSTFTKTGVPTLTLFQAEDLASTTPRKPRQRIGRSDAGHYKVVKLSQPDQEYHLQFSELPQATHDALIAFLEHPLIDYSMHPFTYTDSTGSDHQVRFLDGELPAPEIAPGVFNVSLTLALDRGPLNA